MAEDSKKQSKLTEKDITGLKYFNQIAPLLQRLHDDACDRDTAGKPTKRTFEMICFYFCGLANEEELMAHIEKLKKQTP